MNMEQPQLEQIIINKNNVKSEMSLHKSSKNSISKQVEERKNQFLEVMHTQDNPQTKGYESSEFPKSEQNIGENEKKEKSSEIIKCNISQSEKKANEIVKEIQNSHKDLQEQKKEPEQIQLPDKPILTLRIKYNNEINKLILYSIFPFGIKESKRKDGMTYFGKGNVLLNKDVDIELTNENLESAKYFYIKYDNRKNEKN